MTRVVSKSDSGAEIDVEQVLDVRRGEEAVRGQMRVAAVAQRSATVASVAAMRR